MLFWIFTAIMTVAAAVALLFPLWRATASNGADERAGEAAVYRDQLRELERDKAQGLISAEQADYARAEVGRRLLNVSEEKVSTKAASRLQHALSQIFVFLCLPLIGLGFYLTTGNPGLEDQPLAARMENPGNNLDLLVAKVERHLAQEPNDGAGWDVVAPIYFRTGRMGDAELAYRNAIRLLGTNAQRLGGLGEVLIAQADGVVTEDANSAFQEVLKLEPNSPRAEFYLALGLEQSGRDEEARAAFEALVAKSPADAPWLPLVNQHIASLEGKAPAAAASKAPGNPTAADVAAMQDLSSDDRMAAIRGMVEGLDAKLKEDPDNFEGWMRLVRSYAMLREPDRAMAALKTALETFPSDGEQGKQLVAMASELGLPAQDALK